MTEASQDTAQDMGQDVGQLDERRIARGVALGLPAVTITAAAVVGFVLGVPLAVLVLAAGALLGVIALLWASLRVLSGDAPLPPEIEALDAAAHGVDALASRKTMLLRAIKDLENERALGKLDDEDFQQISETYRKDLKEVLRKIDASLEPFRAKAEALAKEHLEKAKAETPKKAKAKVEAKPAVLEDEDEDEDGHEHDGEDEEESAKGEGSAAPSRVACTSCGESNEPDAKFCKGCGAALEKKAEAADEG